MSYGYSYETKNTALYWKNQTRKPKGITIHHWGSTGSSFDGIVSWFCKSNNLKTSAHYVVQGANANGTVSKRVACVVDPNKIAYHAGNWQANVDTIGLECRPEARDVDYEVVAELIARLWNTYGYLPLYPHRQWVSTSCPGKWNIVRLKNLALAKQRELNSGKPQPKPKPEPKPKPQPKPKPKPASKAISQLATEVIAGKWGNGADRTKRLNAAGYNAAAVQAEVNRRLLGKPKPKGKSVSQLATEVIQGKWGNGADRAKRLRDAGYNYDTVQAEVNRRF